jgi:precorrin-4/cobalt-precorrin-4 C11-methyltransferase
MTDKTMVWFVGAGPGDPELITVKGRRLLREADLVLYTGSLVPKEIAAQARAAALLVDSSGMTLEETHALICGAVRDKKMVVRLHTGDSSLFGAAREQKLLLDAEGIPNAVVPGVSAAFAAAAAAGVSFTVPEAVQSLCITRLHGRTSVPPGQRIRDYIAHGGSMAIYLSAGDPEQLAEELRLGGAPADVPIILACRVGWPDERIIRTTLDSLVLTMQEHELHRQTVVLVLPGESTDQSAPSRLYAGDFSHGYRK